MARTTVMGHDDVRPVIRALGRQVAQVPALKSELASAEERNGLLKRQMDELQKRAARTEASMARLEEALEGILAIQHGKRRDRRLAQAQRIAERGLRKARTP